MFLAKYSPLCGCFRMFAGFGFFVKIHLLDSFKLELYDLDFRIYS